MSFYLRKSISVGPLRFNLSKSGLGLSVGVKGLRLGTGPRGNYVHMGRNGLYYRATLPQIVSTHSSAAKPPIKQPVAYHIPTGTHEQLTDIESADISQIVDSSSKALLNELNQKQKATRIWPIVAVVSIILLAFSISTGSPNWLRIILFLAAIAGVYVAYNRDILAKTVVLFYNFDAEMENSYKQLHSCASKLAGCASAWHIEAEGQVHDRKYHAGASNLVRRKLTSILKAEPPFVKTNIETIAIGVGRQTLHFFPDRVLVYDQNGVGAVSYQELRVQVGTTRFIESASVPRDAKIVDRTWKYVNKSGGPDRRFKDNKELPVCLYEEVSLSSQTGLNEVLQVSQCGLGENFAEAIALLSKTIPSESASRTPPTNSALIH